MRDMTNTNTTTRPHRFLMAHAAETIPVSEGPVATLDIARLGMMASHAMLLVPAEAIGLHYESDPGKERRQYATISTAGVVVLVELATERATEMFAAAMQRACDDEFGGEFSIKVEPASMYNSRDEGWRVAAFLYVDSEGN